jgi:hypothetical protein
LVQTRKYSTQRSKPRNLEKQKGDGGGNKKAGQRKDCLMTLLMTRKHGDQNHAGLAESMGQESWGRGEQNLSDMLITTAE